MLTTTQEKMPDLKSSVETMRFYANWDVDRSSISISRTLSMLFTRLVIKNPKIVDKNSIIIAIRLKGHRRTLRTNDLNISSHLSDHKLDISFAIQYCHSFKKRLNILQILLQRRKRYKNRQIPGYKTLAVGYLNLDEVLQCGGAYQIPIWDTTYLDNKSHRTSLREFHSGTLFINNCHSHPIEAAPCDFSRSNKQETKLLQRSLISGSHQGTSGLLPSDDEEFSRCESGGDSTDVDDIVEPGTSRSNDVQRKERALILKKLGQQRKYKLLLKQKNIKQRLISLIRRFRQEDEVAEVPGSANSVIMPTTELELQEIFDELDNISDYSGPEILDEPDRTSIVTNPRPGLRPFFGSRSSTRTPKVSRLDEVDNEDDKNGRAFSDEVLSNDSLLLFPDADEHESSSAENDEEPSNIEIKNYRKYTSDSETCNSKERIKEKPKTKSIDASHSLPRRPLIRHSSTITTPISLSDQSTILNLNEQKVENFDKQKIPHSSTLSDLISQFDDVVLSSTPQTIVPLHIWLCSTIDLPWLSRVNSQLLGSVRLVNCTTSQEVQDLLQTIINRIQKFCNTNSIAPPTTTLGILGCDKLLADVLQAYVQLLQNKACQEEWLNYLRFSMIVPPTSAIGRLLAQVADGGYSEAAWKALNRIATTYDDEEKRIGSVEHAEIRDCLLFGITTTTPKRTTNLHIGEVMLQLMNNCSVSTNAECQDTPKKSLVKSNTVFIPFLAELLTQSDIGRSSEERNESISPLYYIPTSDVSFQRSEKNDEVFHLTKKSIPASRKIQVANSLGTTSKAPLSDELSDLRTQEQLYPKEQLCIPRISGSPPSITSPLSLSSGASADSRELHIEYWMKEGVNSSLQLQPDFVTPISHSPSSTSVQSSNSKFSIKASIKMLSIAREPVSHQLSILFVKDRKKDKVLQKLARKNKQKSFEVEAGSQHFSSQSRVLSGVSRVVCTIAGGKRAPIMVVIDGVVWHYVRYFQISPQWQTHVKLFPVSFPLLPAVNVWPISSIPY